MASQNFHLHRQWISPLTFHQKKIKLELWEVEHYVDNCEGSEEGVKPQLEEQLMKTKSEVVKLERMLEEELEAEEDVFKD